MRSALCAWGLALEFLRSNAMLCQQLVKRGAAQLNRLCRTTDVSLMPLERLDKDAFLDSIACCLEG